MIKHLNEKKINGLKIRTNNNSINEIIGLWNQVSSEKLEGEVFAVYYNYETDNNGDYDFLIGTQSAKYNNSVTLNEGNYIEIDVMNKTPQGVGEVWQEIWMDSNIQKKRTFEKDFEVYFEDGDIKIYLSVK